MRITFQFNPEKAIQAITYVLEHMGQPVDKVKLTKLLYLADRQSFIAHGVSITGDRLVAMQYGPVPSGCLDLLNGMPNINPDLIYRHLHIEDNQVILREIAPPTLLTESDICVLDEVIRQFGSIPKWTLVRQTHSLPEYQANYVEDTSTTIPFEGIAQASGDERRFRLGRPVISVQTASAMPCPFNPGSDETL